jgi:hypothetical protein
MINEAALTTTKLRALGSIGARKRAEASAGAFHLDQRQRHPQRGAGRKVNNAPTTLTRTNT